MFNGASLRQGTSTAKPAKAASARAEGGAFPDGAAELRRVPVENPR